MLVEHTAGRIVTFLDVCSVGVNAVLCVLAVQCCTSEKAEK